MGILPDESCIHALFVKPKLVFHNFGDRGSINREVVRTLTTFYAETCMTTWCEYALNAHPHFLRLRVALNCFLIPKAPLMLSALGQPP